MGSERVEIQSTENFLALAEAIGEGVALCRDHHIVWASARLSQMTRRTPERLIGVSLDELLQDTGAGLPSPQPESRVVCGVSGRARARVEVRRVPDPSSVDAGVDAEPEMWLFADVSHRLAVDRTMFEVSRELHDANRELARLREDLATRAAEREELLSVVSHELRTPMTVILGYSRLLLSEQMGPLTPEQRQFLEESAGSCQRMNEFVVRMLAASPESVREETLELRDASLEDAIRGVVSFMKPLFDDHGLEVEFEYEFEEGARATRFDPTRIDQVLTNLLGNAMQFATSRVAVKIESRTLCAGGLHFVEVSVTDDGPGVASADRERIFEPYVRGRERGETGGLGLGLAISRRIVEAHGGSISVAQAPGGGSRFVFTLPCVAETGGER